MFMTDGNNEVYTTVVNYVISARSDLNAADNFSGNYNSTPSAFPHISGWTIQDTEAQEGIDSTLDENFTNVGFEWNVYSNKQNGKKAEVEALSELVDTAMRLMGFARVMASPVPNFADATIERKTLRYEAKIDKYNKVYRR